MMIREGGSSEYLPRTYLPVLGAFELIKDPPIGWITLIGPGDTLRGEGTIKSAHTYRRQSEHPKDYAGVGTGRAEAPYKCG